MKCTEVYEQFYHKSPEAVAFCPYRISPLGAHIDHQFGKINGLAIDKGIHMAYRPKQNGIIELQSLNFPKRAQFHVNSVPEYKEGDWADHLRGATMEVFETYQDRLPELWRRRATHYYTEFARAEVGAELWRKGDLEGYGQLVFASGKSSIENYECGCDELKKLYEIMVSTKGIYGGRFSGAGFKGCCMALIDPDYADEIEAKVTTEYLRAYPALEGKYSFHLCESANGVEL